MPLRKIVNMVHFHLVRGRSFVIASGEALLPGAHAAAKICRAAAVTVSLCW